MRVGHGSELLQIHTDFAVADRVQGQPTGVGNVEVETGLGMRPCQARLSRVRAPKDETVRPRAQVTCEDITLDPAARQKAAE